MDKTDPKLFSPVRVKLDRLNLRTPVKQAALSAELRQVINDRNILTCNSRKKMLVELDRLDEKRRDDDKRHTLQEILTSELAYINQIEIIQAYFMRPTLAQRLITPDEFDFLFGNIDSIYKVNGALLDELRQDLMRLTRAFHRMAPFLKLYSEYAFNFKNAMDTLDELMQKNAAFARFIHGQETRPEVQNKLASLLIAPVQRIPRYCLLIKQVLDNTDKDDEEYDTLNETYKKLNDVAERLDSAVEERQNSEKLLHLSEYVKNGKSLIIKPGRRLIRQSQMKLFTDKQKTDIYLILFSDILMFCNIKKTKIEQPNSLKCMCIFPLRKCILQQNVSMMIVIRCEDEKMTVFDENGETAEWFNVLKKTLREYMDNRSTLRKGSSSRRPAVRFNFEAYKDHGVSPNVRGLRKRRRILNEEEEEKEVDVEAIETTPDIKRVKVLQGRKSIHSMIPKLVSKKFGKKLEGSEHKEIHSGRKEKKRDSLFPLREHFLQNEPGCITSTVSTSTNTAAETYSRDVYVFGKENNNRASFSFSGVLNVFSNTFKRAFGFK